MARPTTVLLEKGDEIIIKRLCDDLGQGIEELSNEVILIARLRHKSLVRILGHCIHEEEKIIIY